MEMNNGATIPSIPEYQDIVDNANADRQVILKYKDLVKEKTYAVVSYRYIETNSKYGQKLSMVVRLWNRDVFNQSPDFTREVWSATILSRILREMDLEAGVSLPIWVAIGEETRSNKSGNMYYPAVAKKFTPNEMRAFPWAQEVRRCVDDARRKYEPDFKDDYYYEDNPYLRGG